VRPTPIQLAGMIGLAAAASGLFYLLIMINRGLPF
jgi:hypothetical protein